MKIFTDHREVSEKSHGNVYAIGNFDGLHVGHQELLQQTLRISEEMMKRPAILTFDPHPREFFAPSALPFRLATTAQKTRELASLGAGLCLNQNFEKDFSVLTPSEFVRRVLLDSLRAAHLVVGADFKFGYRQSGNTDMLKELCSQLGIGISVVDQIRVGSETASSSLARDHICEGEMSSAANVLGRPWSVEAIPVLDNDIYSFDLSYYTKIKNGEYAVRIDGAPLCATLNELGDGQQFLSVPSYLNLRRSSSVIIEFAS
ncbi:MAG: FAD synthetase family protein [Alphaproteobacteria bacterium]|nr:FAD synthetase family protein [Alphaproteobacteria bacterium]